jgi:phosphocarrier protein
MVTENNTFQTTVTVGKEFGLHARVATTMVQKLQEFCCEVTLSKDGVEVNARSVLGLLLLAATPGSELTLKAHGPDSQRAIEEICRLIQNEDSQDN